MTTFLLDTDTFTHYLRQHLQVREAITRNQGDVVAISIITLEEIWNGWQKMIHGARSIEQRAMAYDRLTDTVNEIKKWNLISFDLQAHQTYEQLKRLKLNVGSNDLKISAIASNANATIVTANVRDFQRIPNLTVADWTRSPSQ